MPAFMEYAGADQPYIFHFDCPGDAGLADAGLVVGAVAMCENALEFWNQTTDTLLPMIADEPVGTLLSVCQDMKHGLCDKRLLKGGLMLRAWNMTDEGAGILSVVLSISCLCCVIYLIVQSLQFLVK